MLRNGSGIFNLQEIFFEFGYAKKKSPNKNKCFFFAIKLHQVVFYLWLDKLYNPLNYF